MNLQLGARAAFLTEVFRDEPPPVQVIYNLHRQCDHRKPLVEDCVSCEIEDDDNYEPPGYHADCGPECGSAADNK